MQKPFWSIKIEFGVTLRYIAKRLIYRGKSSFFLLAAILLLCVSIAGEAEARKVRSLDETIIRDFIETTSQITAGQDLSRSGEEIASFLKKHLHDDARFSSVMTYTIPGHPDQQSSMALDKSEFIEQIEEGTQQLEDYYTEVEIKDIKISSDKRKATVETEGNESGTMMVPNSAGEMEKVGVEGKSSCHQIVTISDNNIVQLYNANCQTRIIFQQ